MAVCPLNHITVGCIFCFTLMPVLKISIFSLKEPLTLYRSCSRSCIWGWSKRMWETPLKDLTSYQAVQQDLSWGKKKNSFSFVRIQEAKGNSLNTQLWVSHRSQWCSAFPIGYCLVHHGAMGRRALKPQIFRSSFSFTLNTDRLSSHPEKLFFVLRNSSSHPSLQPLCWAS